MERVKKLDDPAAQVRLLRGSEICKLLGINAWTLREWLRRNRFPQPVYVTPGSPMRFRASEIDRWIENCGRKRRRVIRRGRLRRGAER